MAETIDQDDRGDEGAREDEEAKKSRLLQEAQAAGLAVSQDATADQLEQELDRHRQAQAE